MTNERRLLIHRDKATLAGAVAARLITELVDLLDEKDAVHVNLTGGSMGIAVLAAIAESPAVTAVDWSRVHVWWGDERWLPRADSERNERQAREALLENVPVPSPNVHAFAASDDGVELDAAAEMYARQLAEYAAPGDAFPRFDITLLGMGPDAHVASLFPEMPGISVTDRTVIAVRNSPKPPPERLSLTLPVINGSERVWLVVAGEDKASALCLALADASSYEVPAAGVCGRQSTVFFVDESAAAELPEGLRTPQRYWTAAND